MATVTPRNLSESQQRVRSPLERVRGTIRLYVALEGAALLVTLLALWFWVDLAFDYGFFAGFRFDWVQEVPRPLRAAFLGALFLGAVFAVRSGMIVSLAGHEIRTILRTAFAAGGGRHTLPVWLRLPLVSMTVALCAWLGSLVGGDVTGALAAGVSGAVVTALHEALGVRGRSSISAWLRAASAGAGCFLGGYFGFLLGGALAEVAGAVVGAALVAPLGDAAALVVLAVNVLLVRRRCYLVPFAIPILLFFLALWYGAGVLADATGPVGSALLVALFLAGPVLFVVVKRLNYDFHDDALALVLERRFPQQLGDRLITAVELADSKAAAKYGYSEPMIVATIHDAAERVGQVPVREAFDWKRLWTQGGLVVALTAVMYGIAGVVFCLPGWVDGSRSGTAAGFGHFHDVAGLWVERNVLLQNTIWPRQAHLEVIDWPESGDLRVGKDQAAPSLRVRAVKWVVADPGSKEGWRALAWNDLVRRPDLLGEEVKADLVPLKWGEPRDPDRGWTVDEIDLRLEKQEARTDPDVPADSVLALGNVLDRLKSRAADPAMRRTLRVLKVPGAVSVVYRGANGGGEMTFQRQGDNEYSGQFTDLKESIRFTVRGEDYSTKTLYVTVVPTPSLVELVVDEYRPAYMFYRVAGGKSDLLKGKKQLVKGRQVSLYGGDTSRIDPVAAGSDLVLNAKSDKELVSVRIAPPRKGVAEVKADVELLDPRTFRVRFDAVRATPERPLYDFYFEFKDTDNVTGLRHIVIKPIEDAVPDVDVSAEIVRKTSQGYLVTPLARIPLRGKVSDDYGLESLEFACTYGKIDKGADGGVRGVLAISALHWVPGGLGMELAAAARLAAVTRDAKAASAKAEADSGVKKYPIVPFAQLLASPSQRREFWTMEQIDKQLADKPPEHQLTKFYELLASERDPVREPEYFFNTERLGLKVDETRDIQPRYRMQLWVEAVDNDVETGPHRGLSKEKLTFLIVSENELLSEIAKEEEGLYTKLLDRVNNLQEGGAKLDRIKEDLTAAALKAEQFGGMAVRTDDVAQTVERAEGIIGEVHGDYRRILQEMVVNRVQAGMIDRVEKQICNPLQDALEKDFPSVKQGLADLRKALDGEGDLSAKTASGRKATDEARERLNTLVRKLTGVLDQMQQLAGINELIKMVRNIEQQEVATGDTLKKLKKQLEDDILKGLEGLK